MTKLLTSKFFIPVIQTLMGAGIIAMSGGIWYYGSTLTAQPRINEQLKASIELTQKECKERNVNTNYRIDKVQDRQAKVDSMFVQTMIEMKEMKKQIEFIYVNNKELNKYMNVFNMSENDRRKLKNNGN